MEGHYDMEMGHYGIEIRYVMNKIDKALLGHQGHQPKIFRQKETAGIEMGIGLLHIEQK
jgi:hypothetical protein